MNTVTFYFNIETDYPCHPFAAVPVLSVSVIWFIASHGELHWQHWFAEHLGRNSIETFKK